ncbi:MAG: hypothetical protein ACOCWQ_02095 [Nanoarchaeota archaeon]
MSSRPEPEEVYRDLASREEQPFTQKRKKAVEDSIARLQQPIPEDSLIIHALDNVHELDTIINTLSSRLRNWYSLYGPEISAAFKENREFAQRVLEQEKDALLAETHQQHDTGGSLSDQDLAAIRQQASQVLALFASRDALVEYIEKKLQEGMPNLYALATPMIAASLISAAGSLSRLSRLPGSAIQILGAEDALFRHIHSNAPPPKYGILLSHPLVMKAARKEQGKMARRVANSMAIAARADYYASSTTLGAELLAKLREDT